MDAKPLVQKAYIMQKFPGKGGWTYVVVPEILQNKKERFGWVRVKGSIDKYQFKQYKMMPMGNNQLFLPIKAAVRKQIKKEAGDTVMVTLYADESPIELTEELRLCFENEPKKVYQAFLELSEGQQKSYIDWIYSAKMDETKASRIVQMMDELLN